MLICIPLVEGDHATAEELHDVLMKLGHQVTVCHRRETDLIVRPTTLELNGGGSGEEPEGANADAGEITWETGAGERSETFKMIAVSVASTLLLTEATLDEKREKKPDRAPDRVCRAVKRRVSCQRAPDSSAD